MAKTGAAQLHPDFRRAALPACTPHAIAALLMRARTATSRLRENALKSSEKLLP